MNKKLQNIRRLVKWVNYFCVIQFLFILIYIELVFHPVTKVHMAVVGLSGAAGLVLAGSVRRYYQKLKARADKEEKELDLKNALKRINENKNL